MVEGLEGNGDMFKVQIEASALYIRAEHGGSKLGSNDHVAAACGRGSGAAPHGGAGRHGRRRTNRK